MDHHWNQILLAGVRVPTRRKKVLKEGQETETEQNPFKDREPIGTELAVKILAFGKIQIVGRMPWASNGTFLTNIKHDEIEIQGIYKPAKGERPLYDFPPGIYKREVAAFELADYLGWGLIPPTVLREGPLGIGSLQLFVPCDYEKNYFTIHKDPKFKNDLVRLATFDLLANNTDRKAGHVLEGNDGSIWAIDNSLCFHEDFKIRTVIWDFSGREIPKNLISDMSILTEEGTPESLSGLLNVNEIEALINRANILITNECLPHDPSGRQVPWPLL